LPADDVLPPDSLALRAAYLDAHPEADFVYGHVFTFDQEDPASGVLAGTDITTWANPCEAFIRGNPIHGMGVMARAHCWRGTGDHDEALDYSDWQFWFRMFSRYRGAFIPSVLARQRSHGRNYSLGSQPRRYREYTHALLLNLEAIWARTVPALDVPRNRARLQMMLALHSFFAGRLAEASDGVRRSFEIDAEAVTDKEFLSGWLFHGVYYWVREADAAPADFLAWFGEQTRKLGAAGAAAEQPLAEVSFAVLPQLVESSGTRHAAARILLRQAAARPWATLKHPQSGRTALKYLLGVKGTHALRRLKARRKRGTEDDAETIR
jgi:hypothetical protein